MRLWGVLVLLIAFSAFLSPAIAQERVALVADRIEALSTGELRAEGDVEILFRGTRLRAAAVTYSRNRDIVTIEGPLSLNQGDGFILLAEAGELDQDFRNGVLSSARMVLEQHLQVAAAELNRADGRYTQLFKAVATTCPVCSASETPLWQIRSTRVIHDQLERQLYFRNAIFEVAGFPIFYTPRLRMPDATVERDTGFLIPTLKTSTVLGAGIQVPYFIEFGPHADLTITPYVSNRTRTLGFRYRQLFRSGAITFTGSGSQDDLLADATRGYLFGNGVFFLRNDFELRFNVELSSDKSYIFDYGISNQDRLQSNVEISRIKPDSAFSAQLISFRSFRDDEDFGTIPSQVGDVDFVSRFDMPVLGGVGEYRLQAYGLIRTSDIDVVGRDYGRVSAGLGWRRQDVIGPGLVFGTEVQADVDHYEIAQDTTAGSETVLTVAGAAELRWPLIRHQSDGSHQILEPIVQLVFSSAKAPKIPNEESTLVEFDEGSLWAIDRIPGASEYETGNRLNIGFSWSATDAQGRSIGLTAGRVIRDMANDQFTSASGLSGTRSDWLLVGAATLGQDLAGTTRFLLADDLSVTRNDTRLTWASGKLDVALNFLWHIAEPEVGRDDDTWELHTDAVYRFNDNWSGTVDLRYDLTATRAAAAGLRLIFTNPCLTAALSFSRTFTSSISVTPKTDFTISLSVPPVAVASKRARLSCDG